MSTSRQYLISALLTFTVFGVSYLLLGKLKAYDAFLIQLIVLWVSCEVWYFLLWNITQLMLLAKSPEYAEKYPFNDGFFMSSYLSCIAFFIMAFRFELPPISVVAWVRSSFSHAVFPMRDDEC